MRQEKTDEFRGVPFTPQTEAHHVSQNVTQSR